MKWLLGIILLLIASLLLESGLLAYVAYALLALLIVGRLLGLSWIEKLWATRVTSATELQAGDALRVQITVHNKGGYPVPWLLLEDMLPAGALHAFEERIHVQGNRIRITTVPANGYAELDYRIDFQTRGYFQIGPLVLETGDFFGLHRRYRVAADPVFVAVYPRLVGIDEYELSSRRPVGTIRFAHRLYEDPTRINGVREYETGDPLKRVHWPASARTGKLHSKLYDPSCIAGATILLDFHQRGYPEATEPARSDFAATAAASVAFALFQSGRQVGLVTNGRDAVQRVKQEGWRHDFRSRKEALAAVETFESEDRLRPLVVETGRGAEQFDHIRAALARLELHEGLPFADMVAESAGHFPGDAAVIALLPRVTNRTVTALGNLHRRGCSVVAVLVMLPSDAAKQAEERLVAEGIAFRRADDDESLATICRGRVGVLAR